MYIYIYIYIYCLCVLLLKYTWRWGAACPVLGLSLASASAARAARVEATRYQGSPEGACVRAYPWIQRVRCAEKKARDELRARQGAIQLRNN